MFGLCAVQACMHAWVQALHLSALAARCSAVHTTCCIVCLNPASCRTVMGAFDSVILLAGGRLVFQGSCDAAQSFLESLGHT